jgi:2-phosphosulfolactate phosphatase
MLAKVCPVVAVVDVLRFTTAVEVAVARGALVLPHRWSDRAAVPPGPFSLSPASLLAVPPETRLQLPSPNGATVALAAAAGAVSWPAACATPRPWPGRPATSAGGLRPAVEDLVGAGAVPLAAEHDVSQTVPLLRDGAFGQLSWPG